MSLFQPTDGNLLELVSKTDSFSSLPRNPDKKSEPGDFATSGGQGALRPKSATIDLDAWSARAEMWAQQARKVRDFNPDSPAAYSRLAHAEQCAGNKDAAVAAAEACLRLVYKRSAESGFRMFDFPSAFAAATTLAEEDRRDLADDLLAELPPTLELRRLRARFAVETGRMKSGLRLLAEDESAEAASLRGYIYLIQEEYAKALHELRLAWSEDNRRADTVLNMAVCFSKLGSLNKAITAARQASKLAPSRRDISLTLLDLLATSGQVEAGRSEVRRLKSLDDARTTGLAIAEARIELVAGARDKGRSLLQAAARGARDARLFRLEKELEADVAILAIRSEEDAELARLQVKRRTDEEPESVALVKALSHLSRKRQHYGALQESFARVEGSCAESFSVSLQAKLAYLKCDFADHLRLTQRWQEVEPLLPTVWAERALLLGQVQDDWKGAGRLAIQTLRKFGPIPSIANNIAYTLALAGRSDVAQDVLDCSSTNMFYQRATSGLVQIVKGDLDEGMKLYREAANQADREADGGRSRALMTIHQGFALRHLNLLPVTGRKSIIAKALPPVTLPHDWEDWPGFVLLRDAAVRHDWSWPLTID